MSTGAGTRPPPGAADASPAGDVELARAYRSGLHESTHYGALVVLERAGEMVWHRGDVHRPVFHRSCAKPFLAVAMVDAGLAVSTPDLALAASSHAGEPEHVSRVLAMLDAAGLTEDDLGCPPDLPVDRAARDEVIRSGGGPRRVYMNCSGKHAAMLATCVRAGWPTAGYLDPEHPLQQGIRAGIELITGSPTHGESGVDAVGIDAVGVDAVGVDAVGIDAVGIDGCGAPVFATDLIGLARGFSALVTAESGTARRTVADAMRSYPILVGGTASGDTLLMQRVPGLLVKLGADGVQAFALPDGRAVAFKIADGGERARLPIILAALDFLDVHPDVTPGAPGSAFSDAIVLGGGQPVGAVVAAPNLFR